MDRLTKREQQFVDLLLKANGIPVSLTALHLDLWPDREADLQQVRVLAHRVRTRRPDLKIESIFGRGYVINAAPCPSCRGTGWQLLREDAQDG